jgi:hypothetical protein
MWKLNNLQLYGGHVLLVASQILLGSFLVVNHPVHIIKKCKYYKKEKIIMKITKNWNGNKNIVKKYQK